MSDSKAVKVEADEVTIKVKCRGKNGEKKAAASSSAPAPPAAAPAKRKASEKQLEHLKKAREARAAKKAAEGGTSKAAEKPKASTSKAAEPKPSTSKPKEEPKKEFDFDALRERARAAADKVISIKMLQNIYLGLGSFAQIEKRNREEAAEMFSRVLSDLKIRKRKGVFISGGHTLTERQGELLVKAIGITLRKKYLDSNEAKEDDKDERSKDRPTQIGNTLLMFSNDDKSMKELFRLVLTA